ncbi:MAG: hypothetical protein HC831_14685 [Chloroflexia bacterium]|nr:hypothetical protein [Chloroflexia bacterium]
MICCMFAWQSMAQTSNLTLTSANQELVDHFNWAKNRALDLVITGEEDYTETAYWGSYAHDPWYCIRDITHQSEAGHLLGLDEENFNMMRKFALSTKDQNTSQKDWVAWKIDFYGNTSRFTRELPSPFDCGATMLSKTISGQVILVGSLTLT